MNNQHKENLHIGSSFDDFLSPYLTHAINIHLKTTYYVIKNLRAALHLEK